MGARAGSSGQAGSTHCRLHCKKKRARPAFEIPEYRRLWRTLHKRTIDAGNVRTLRTRELLTQLCFGARKFRLRIGEKNNLKLRDVMPFRDAKGRNNFRFIVRGKTGERDVILRSGTRRVDKMLAKRTGDNPNNFLFAMPKGTRIISLIDQFNMALKQAGIEGTVLEKSTSFTAFAIFTL